MLHNIHCYTDNDYEDSNGTISFDRPQVIVEENQAMSHQLFQDGDQLKNNLLDNSRCNTQNVFYHQQHNQQGQHLISSRHSKQNIDIVNNIHANNFPQNQHINSLQSAKLNNFQAVQHSCSILPTQAHTLSSTFSCEKENNGYIPNLCQQPNIVPYPAKSTALINQNINNPKIQEYNIHKEVKECPQYQQLPTNTTDCVLNSPQLLPYQPDTTPVHLRFKEDIILHLLQTEEKHRSFGGYIGTIQKEINERMRGILLDWLVEVHFKLKLQTETLFMAVNLTDRYLEKIDLESSRLQLLGITALFVASKYEEVYAVPHVKDLVYVCDNAYTAGDIFTMESSLLLTLDFNILSVSSFRLLDFFMQNQRDVSDKNYFLARYLIEIALLEYKLIVNPPSLIAASAIYLVNKIRKLPVSWNLTLERTSGYSENAVRPCAKQICNILQSIESRKHLASLRKKFSKSQFLEVARIKIENKKEYSNSLSSGHSNHANLANQEKDVVNTSRHFNITTLSNQGGQNFQEISEKNVQQNGQMNIQRTPEEESTQTQIIDQHSNLDNNEELLENVEYLDVAVGVEAARTLIERIEQFMKGINISRINQSQLYGHGVSCVNLKLKSEIIVGLLEKKLGTTSTKQLWKLPTQLAKIVINSMFQSESIDSLQFVTPQFLEVLLESLLQGHNCESPCY